MRRAVYVSPIPLTERFARDWCYGYLREHGVPAEFWDVSAIWPVGQGSSRPGQEGLTLVPDFERLAEMTARPEYADAVFIVLVSHDGKHHDLFRLLTRLRRTTCVFEWGHLPVRSYGRRLKILELLRNPVHAPVAVWNKLKTVGSRRLGLVKPYDLVFAAGRSAAAVYPNAKKTVPINLCDYDLYQEIMKDPKRVLAEPYCVFLDNAQAHNPDIGVEGMPYLDKAAYFASLNRFFKLTEERFGLPVVIAAHPKSDYPPSLFEGRRILKGLTPQLVKDADLVLCHHSTAIGYAVLARKPLLFFFTGEMGTLYAETRIRPMRGFAACLGAPVLDADALRSAAEIPAAAVDEARYTDYQYDFLTNRGTEHERTCDIVLRELGGKA